MKQLATAIAGRMRAAVKEIITWLNGLGTLVALYALQNPVVSDKLLGFVPGDWRDIAAVILPVAWFWLVQKGKEVDKARQAVKP